MELRPGALIADRFRVERKVGAGGMGEVWSGEQLALGVRVALKTLLPAAVCDPQLVARFRREAYLLGRIRSDYVARIVDFVTDPEVGLVLVMEFVEGELLGDVIAKRSLTVEETLDLGIDLASGLCDLHRAQVVHRDLKPDNILLQPQTDGRRRAMIVDFGVGKAFSDESLATGDDELTSITHADVAVGTIAYMAPEQLLNSRGVTGAADIYALGAILYHAATGEQVFGSIDNDLEYAKKKLVLPPTPLTLPRFDRAARGLQAAVARALAKNPAGRFESAQAMLSELTMVREIARGLAMDLDAITDMAPLSSLPEELGGDARLSDTAVINVPTRPRADVGDSDDSNDKTPAKGTSPGAEIADEPTTLTTGFALMEAVARLPALVVEPTSPAVEIMRPAPVDPAPETVRALPPSAPERRTLALFFAVLGGVVLGFFGHWALAAALSMH
jgi:serine/threonine protein kinase